MRILVLIHEFPPIGGGGGRVAYDLCSHLAQKGYDIKILTSGMKGTPKIETLNGLEVHRLSTFRKEIYQSSLHSMSVFTLTSAVKALTMFSRWRPDIIHAHFAVPGGVPAWILNRITRLPYVITIHLGDVPGGVPEKTDQWFRWIFPLTNTIWNHADKIIAVSEYTRELALKSYPVGINVIYNGVDLKETSPPNIRVNTPPRIVFAGRFVPQKNPLQVITSLAELKNLDWQCVMIGDGELKSAIEAEIEKHGLEGRIEITGWITPNEVFEWYKKSDILFLPSFSEGLPVVGIQALAMGMAVIASDIGGCKDLVVNGLNGFLVAPTDSQGFTDSLAEFIQEPARLLASRTASLEQAKRFDIENVTYQYECIFEEIARNHHKAPHPSREIHSPYADDQE